MFKRKSAPQETAGRRRATGSEAQRQPAFSYYAQRTRPEERQGVARREPLPRSKRELLHFFSQRFGLIIVIIATIALLISSIQLSRNPRVQIVNDGAVYRIHPDSVYQAALSQELKTSWTNTNKLTINTDHVALQLRQRYPELADVAITLPVLGQRPIAYVQLTRPSLLVVTDKGGAFLVDETGRVLAPASQVSDLDSFKLPTITDQSGLDVHVGKLLLSGPTVQFIKGVTYQLQAAHVAYDRLVLPAGTQELDVYLSGKAYYGRFNMHDSATARQQSGAFLATQADLTKQGKQPTTYIDVRLTGRAYYK